MIRVCTVEVPLTYSFWTYLKSGPQLQRYTSRGHHGQYLEKTGNYPCLKSSSRELVLDQVVKRNLIHKIVC